MFLQTMFQELRRDARDTAGFEIVFPALLERADTLGLDLPFEEVDWLHGRRERKLQLLARLDDLGHSVYNLEAFDALPHEVINGTARSPESGVGCSPAATARVLKELDDPAAWDYLRSVVELFGADSAPAVYPFDIFERSWVLADLQRAAVDLPEMRPSLQALATAWSPQGCGMASQGIPGDGDCSALVYTVLRQAGHSLPPWPLDTYRTPAGYVTYLLELDPSASCNAHMLIALRQAEPALPGAIECAVDYLRSNRRPTGGWSDKWHISPYYATAHAIEGLHGVDEVLCRDGTRWVLRTQLPDGSWGIAGGSAEETAYALTALFAATPHLDAAGHAAIDRGASYLSAHVDTHDHPELWVGKALYAPALVIRGTILATLWRYIQLGRRTT
jgi:halimadienyl-diphosphate synthase